MNNEQRSLVTYKPMPAHAEDRAYVVGGALLRVMDRLGLRPAPDRLYIISEINVYRRRMAVYSVPSLDVDAACIVVERVVQSVGCNMLVMPPVNGHIDFVCDLYTRDLVEFLERM